MEQGRGRGKGKKFSSSILPISSGVLTSKSELFLTLAKAQKEGLTV